MEDALILWYLERSRKIQHFVVGLHILAQMVLRNMEKPQAIPLLMSLETWLEDESKPFFSVEAALQHVRESIGEEFIISIPSMVQGDDEIDANVQDDKPGQGNPWHAASRERDSLSGVRLPMLF